MDVLPCAAKPAFERHAPRYGVVIFGKPDNYSLTQMIPGHPHRSNLSARIRDAALALGVGDIYAPGPVASNAAYIDYRDLTTMTELGDGVRTWRNPDKEADVIMVPKGAAMMMSIASCTGIAAYSGTHLLAAHAGRECVIDRNRILGKHPRRAVEGIAETIIGQFQLLDTPPSSIRIAMFGSIPARMYLHPLDHPEHGAFNRLLGPYIRDNGWTSFAGLRTADVVGNAIRLDIPRLVAAQFLQKGVPPLNIDLRHAYADPETMWLDGARGKPRNLFMLVHR